MLDPLYFDRRLTVAVPDAFRETVRSAAAQAGLTIADYARASLVESLTRDGLGFDAPPLLHRLAAAPPEIDAGRLATEASAR